MTNAIKNELQIRYGAWNERYLGLPVYVERSMKQTFAYLKKKTWGCIQGWKEKVLSKDGKEILVKAVVQAIPTFAMSCFYLPKRFCDDLSSVIASYCWS